MSPLLWISIHIVWVGQLLAAVQAEAGYLHPCAEVAKKYDLFSNGDESIKVDAELAYECLSSVPIVQEDAVSLITSLRGWLKFQSTLDYLASPPRGWLFPPIDILEILDQIQSKVTNNKYSSEYDLQVDLHTMTLLGKDGHLSTKGPMMDSLAFWREERLISLSEDGETEPSVYLLSDRYLEVDDNLFELRPGDAFSAITKINSLPVQDFLQLESLTGTLQDPDSLYNILHYPYNAFIGPQFYPGPFTNITFSNGSSKSFNNLAIWGGDLSGVVDGKGMYDRFFEAPVPADESGASAHGKIKRNELSNADAVLKDDAGAIVGYWGEGLPPDLAVIAITSFHPSEKIGSNVNFQETLKEILASTKRAGKKKLILDVRMNGGGSVALCLDTMVQLFPDTTPDTKSNMRASRAQRAIIEYFSEQTKIAEDEDPDDPLDEEEIESERRNSPWAYQTVVSPDFKNFDSVDQFYGPHHEGPGLFTSFFQENYTNNEYSLIEPTIMNITQAVPGADWPFSPENIVILSDGVCASACSIFVEHLKTKFRVMSIAIGGRPQPGPMQTIGGVRGSRLFETTNLQKIGEAYESQVEAHPASEDPDLEDWGWEPLDRFGPGLRLNGFNAYRMGGSENIPLHFVYEAADCKIWYTPEMIEDKKVLWHRVAELAFTNRVGDVISSKYCVEGSTKHPTSISGAVKQEDLGPQTPPENAFPRLRGWIVNGTTVTQENLGRAHGFGPGTADRDNDGELIDPVALETFKSLCAEVSEDLWFIKLMCLSVQ